MLDVIAVLRPPLPWDNHGAMTSLPGAMQARLSRWQGGQQAFFCTTGTAEETIQALGFKAPGLVAGDGVTPQTLAPATLADVQAAVDAGQGQDRRRHLRITGQIAWAGTLQVRAQGLTLDFSAAEIVVTGDGPLIAVSASRRVTLSGLRCAARLGVVVDLRGGEDLALTGCALGGAQEAAVQIGAGCRRVLVDASAFVGNAGASLRVLGGASQVVIARSVFERATAQPFIDLQPDATDIRILENRFTRAEAEAIRAEGTCGLWVEANDMAALAGSAVSASGEAVGVMVADNRLHGLAGAKAPLVALADSGLICVFRNTFDPLGQEALNLSGRFGGVVVGANSALVQAWPGGEAAFRLAPSGKGAFLATVVMTNTIRGPFGCGIALDAALPRLFVLDNHIFGTRSYSLASQVAQPGATLVNNWSPEPSLRIPLSEGASRHARVIRWVLWPRLLARLRR